MIKRKGWAKTLVLLTMLGSFVISCDTSTLSENKQPPSTELNSIKNDKTSLNFKNKWYHTSNSIVEPYIKKLNRANKKLQATLTDSILLKTADENLVAIAPLKNGDEIIQWVYLSNSKSSFNYFFKMNTDEEWRNKKLETNDRSLIDWTGEIEFFDENLNTKLRQTFSEGKITFSKVYSSDSNLLPTDINPEEEGFYECMEEAFLDLPLPMQIFCGTACGACLWSLNPYGCGACAGCIGGTAFHCYFLED